MVFCITISFVQVSILVLKIVMIIKNNGQVAVEIGGANYRHIVYFE